VVNICTGDDWELQELIHYLGEKLNKHFLKAYSNLKNAEDSEGSENDEDDRPDSRPAPALRLG
jgi:hypothetical protein